MTLDPRVTNDPWKAVAARLLSGFQTRMTVMGMKLIAGIVLLTAASGAMAHDALLAQALARTAMPASELHGTLKTVTTVRGGDKPEIETETQDLARSPDKALASYAELKEVIGPDARVLSREAGRTVYTFTTRRVPRGYTGGGRVNVNTNNKNEDDDIKFEGRAEVSMDAKGAPYVSHLDLHMPQAQGNLLARIKKIDLSYAFAPWPTSDAMVATAVTADVDVRALFFVHRDVRAESVLVTDASTK